MKVLIAGTPLESMVWQREIGKVRIRWRDVDADMKARFVSDLIKTLIPLQVPLWKEAKADGSYKPKEIDWDAIDKLPKPNLSGDELIALMRDDEPDETQPTPDE